MSRSVARLLIMAGPLADLQCMWATGFGFGGQVGFLNKKVNCTDGFWGLVCYAATQLALQVHQPEECIQVFLGFWWCALDGFVVDEDTGTPF